VAVTLCRRSISSLEMSENLLKIRERVLPDLFLVGSGARVDVAHEQRGRDAAGEVGLVGGEADDEGDDVVIDVVVGVEVQKLGDGADCPLAHHGLVVRAQILEVGKDQRVLDAEHRPISDGTYARVAYYSVTANTTSSSSFLQRASRKGSSVVLMA